MWLYLLLSCHPCTLTDWGDMTLQADEDVPASTVERVAAQLEQFIDWTGREQSCVQGITLRSDYDVVHGGYAQGSFRRATGEIQVSTAFDDPESSLVHELCHAIDQQDGTSRRDRDLFPRGSLDRGDGRPAKPSEVFALTCDRGPQQATRWQLVEQQCEVAVSELSTAALQRVQETVYVDAESGADWGSATARVEAGQPWALTAPEPNLSLAGIAAGSDHVVVVWRSVAVEGRVVVDHLAPGTGTPELWQEIETCGPDPDYCHVELLPGPEGPWIHSQGGTSVGERRLWRLSPEGATETRTPCLSDSWDLVVDGQLWSASFMVNYGPVNQEATLQKLDGCEIETGEERSLDAPTPLFPRIGWELSWAPPTLTWVDQAPAVWWRGAALSWPDAQGWQERELPTHLDLAAMAIGAEGGFEFLVLTPTADGRRVLGLVRYEPISDTWSAPVSSCVELPPPDEEAEEEIKLLRGQDWSATAHRTSTSEPWTVVELR